MSHLILCDYNTMLSVSVCVCVPEFSRLEHINISSLLDNKQMMIEFVIIDFTKTHIRESDSIFCFQIHFPVIVFFLSFFDFIFFFVVIDFFYDDNDATLYLALFMLFFFVSLHQPIAFFNVEKLYPCFAHLNLCCPRKKNIRWCRASMTIQNVRKRRTSNVAIASFV